MNLVEENLALTRKLLVHLRAGLTLSKFNAGVSVGSGLALGVGVFYGNQAAVWMSLGAIFTNFLLHTVYFESLRKP